MPRQSFQKRHVRLGVLRVGWLAAALCCSLLCASIDVARAAPAQIKDVRISTSPDSARVVFELTTPVGERVFTLANPDRVVIDIADAQLDAIEKMLSDALPSGDGGLIRSVRAGERDNGILRVVLDTARHADARSFTLDATNDMGPRLVVDLDTGKNSEPALDATGNRTAAAAAPSLNKPVPTTPAVDDSRLLVIAVDAGHGGEDPGAIGRHGTREKDVTLAIARWLKVLIDAEPGMRAVLTRNSDRFVPLRERIVLARKQKADLFISIHADSVRDRHVGGASVYVLSAGRASNEAARMLADRENAADLMGGVSLEDKDDVLASVILDISQNASMSASVEAADQVLANLDRVGPVLDRDVKHASLKVLTSPNMPSMLVETAFISNPREEAKLKNPHQQERLASAIAAGVRAYFYDHPPPRTLIAQLAARQRGSSNADAANMTMMAGSIAH